MGSMLLAITANTAMIFAMKFADKAKTDKRTVILFNYLFGSVLAFVLGGGFRGGMSFGQETVIPVGLAIFNAFLMVACMLIQQNSIGINGAGITTTYNRLGVLIPTVLSIFLFQEYPTILKIAGIILSVAAILYSYEKGGEGRKNYMLLVLVLVIGGFIDFNSKLLGIIAVPEMKNIYTFSTFVFSGIITLVIVLVQKAEIGKKELLYGAMIGIPNICITFGMVSAAAVLPAYILFPVYSGAVILLVNSIGALLLKEKLSRKELVSTGMIAVALVMLNI